MSFDALRRQHPDLGFAVYGIEPDGPVTLEMHAFGAVETIVDVSLAACIAKAFPPKPSRNELTPLPAAPAAPVSEEHPGIPDFLLRAPKTAPDSVFD